MGVCIISYAFLHVYNSSYFKKKTVKEQAEKMILKKSILPGGDREYKTRNLRLIQGFKKEHFQRG